MPEKTQIPYRLLEQVRLLRKQAEKLEQLVEKLMGSEHPLRQRIEEKQRVTK